MVRLFTTFYILPDGCEYIEIPDAVFDTTITPLDLDAHDYKLMNMAEGIKVVDRDKGLFKTRFNICNLYQLSSGLKTLLLIRHLKDFDKDRKVAVNITACGENLIEAIFKETDYSGFPLVLRHFDLYSCEDRIYVINDKYTTDDGMALQDLLRVAKRSKRKNMDQYLIENYEDSLAE